MPMRHITIIAKEVNPGELARITTLLGDRGINIEDLDLESSTDRGVINLTVDHYDIALQTLRDAGYPAISEDALVVQMEDQPGALARIASRFVPAGLKLRSMHIIRREEGKVWVSLVTADNATASTLLEDVLVSK